MSNLSSLIWYCVFGLQVGIGMAGMRRYHEDMNGQKFDKKLFWITIGLNIPLWPMILAMVITDIANTRK